MNDKQFHLSELARTMFIITEKESARIDRQIAKGKLNTIEEVAEWIDKHLSPIAE